MVCSTKKQNYYFESIVADGLELVRSDGSALLYTGNISAEDLEAAVNTSQSVKLTDEGWELSDCRSYNLATCEIENLLPEGMSCLFVGCEELASLTFNETPLQYHCTV